MFIGAGAVGAAGPAFAADMTGADLRAFLLGKTIYLELTGASARHTRPGRDLLGQ
jgi:hypothetical protein